MKRLLVLCMLVASVLFADAKSNPLRLKSGTLAPLKTEGRRISCTFDFSQTRANRKPLEQYLVEDYHSTMEDFNRYVPEMHEWFVEKWNDDIEEGPTAVISDNEQLKLVVVVRTLQLGSKSGWGGSSISGYVHFYKDAKEEPFAVVEVLKMNGTQMGGTVAGYYGLKQVFNDLAEYLCDLIYHY